jgi:hypothetical protein
MRIMETSKVNLSIMSGLPAVNADLTVDIVDPSQPDRALHTGKPFRDGTLNFPSVLPGVYEMVIRHPNILVPVTRRPIRVLPGETKLSVLIDPAKFRNTPIEDVPDANLQPVIDAVRDVEEDARGLGNKRPGEAILASSWNAMAASVESLARSVGELARLVAPQGHNHPEYERKIDEMSTNFETLLNTLTASMAEIQRRLQIERIDAVWRDAFDGIEDTPAVVAAKRQIEALVRGLEEKVTESPRTFSDLLRNATEEIQRLVNAAVTAGSNQPAKDKIDKIRNAADQPPARSHAVELVRYQKLSRETPLTKRNLVP